MQPEVDIWQPSSLKWIACVQLAVALHLARQAALSMFIPWWTPSLHRCIGRSGCHPDGFLALLNKMRLYEESAGSTYHWHPYGSRCSVGDDPPLGLSPGVAPYLSGNQPCGNSGLVRCASHSAALSASRPVAPNPSMNIEKTGASGGGDGGETNRVQTGFAVG